MATSSGVVELHRDEASASSHEISHRFSSSRSSGKEGAVSPGTRRWSQEGGQLPADGGGGAVHPTTAHRRPISMRLRPKITASIDQAPGPIKKRLTLITVNKTSNGCNKCISNIRKISIIAAEIAAYGTNNPTTTQIFVIDSSVKYADDAEKSPIPQLRYVSTVINTVDARRRSRPKPGQESGNVENSRCTLHLTTNHRASRSLRSSPVRCAICPPNRGVQVAAPRGMSKTAT